MLISDYAGLGEDIQAAIEYYKEHPEFGAISSREHKPYEWVQES